ncbi:hypothetical protein HBI26_024640 [Parastagonospora nodorum]|nr:hypothetical protein HBI26_024640 [Parastagonospora nodorum]
MASTLQLGSSLLGTPETCGSEGTIRQFNNKLYTQGEEFSELTVPEYDFTPLNTDPKQARLLRLHPATDLTAHVCCNLEVYDLTELPSFTAIKNARGYRNIKEAIEADGRALFVSIALERFLRYLRSKIDDPILIWVRYACVVESNPKEQETYWTREFSDAIYARASEVIDMHEINNHLIGNGYFETVCDSRYSSWTKQWSGNEDQMVLPRVCPVRLGTKLSIEAPSEDYRYVPLDMVTDEIRVINIMPAEDATASIVMHAAHCPIRCEASYIALSYRWGTDETPEHVVLNGQRKAIRKKLAEAIRSLRMKERIVPMWIDAISINQDDVSERGRQVRRMGTIYDCARHVYSYTGRAESDTEEVMNFMAELGTHPVIHLNEMGEFLTDGKFTNGETRIKPERLAQLFGGLYKFTTRHYFRRSWILQEISWASDPSILTDGKMAVTFDMLDRAVYHLHDLLTRDLSLAARMQAVNPSLGTVDIKMLGYPRTIYYFRYLLSNGHAGGGLFGGGFLTVSPLKKNSPGFLETLILARDFECTDPRDHIFALWNLARDKGGLEFQPDYTNSYENVYTGFSQAWIEQHASLDILGAVEPTPDAASFYSKAPSWCPNWNLPATASCLVRKDQIPARSMSCMPDLGGKLYGVDRSITRDLFDSPIISFDGRTLHCTGIIIDQIGKILDDAPAIPAGTAPKSIWRAHFWLHELETYYRKQGLTTYHDPLRAAWAMFHGDGTAAWPPAAESGYSPNQYPPNVPYVCLPKLSRHVPTFAASYDPIEARTAADWVLRGRRPFFTENGYMGLAPAYLAEPEHDDGAVVHIAVVLGCSVPLLLRDRDDGTYQLVGTCFVQGWMDGEWMETIMGVESPKEFWDAVQDGAKLAIT